MRNLLLISLLLSTGLRISELCNLKLDNINLENRTIQILGKGKKERLLYIGNDETLSLLEDYIAHHCSHSSYLFTGVKNDDHLKEPSVRLILKNISHSLQLKNISLHICFDIVLQLCCLIMASIFDKYNIYWATVTSM